MACLENLRLMCVFLINAQWLSMIDVQKYTSVNWQSKNICHQSIIGKHSIISHIKIIILISNPSEDEKQGHRSFTLKCKHELLAKIESSHAFSSSLEEACQQFGIQSGYYCQWKKQLDLVPNSTSSNMRKLHLGHPGSLVPTDNRFPRYVFELCEQGIVVTMQILSKRASDFCRFFCELDGAKHWLCIGG